MKRKLTHLFLLCIAFAILASSTGVTVFKMVCLRSGKETVSLTQIKNCCEEEQKEGLSWEEKCCAFSAQTFKVSLLHKLEFNTTSFEFISSPKHCASLSPISLHLFSSLIFSDSSPPKTGRQILCFNSIFLI